MNFGNLSKNCLHLPEKVIERYDKIAEHEKKNAKKVIIDLLDKNEENINNLDRDTFKHLINAIVFVYRRPQCIKAVNYLISKLKSHINPNYFPAYNFVFMGATATNGLITQAKVDVISQMIYNKHERELSTIELRKCQSILVLIKEIYAVSQLIQTDLEFDGQHNLINLYNIIDKFNELFKTLFQTQVFDIFDELEPHRNARNSIAHGHFIIEYPDEKEVPDSEVVYITPKMVKWSFDRINQENFVEGFFNDYYDLSVLDIRLELIYLSVFICQFLLFFQILKQIL